MADMGAMAHRAKPAQHLPNIYWMESHLTPGIASAVDVVEDLLDTISFWKGSGDRLDSFSRGAAPAA